MNFIIEETCAYWEYPCYGYNEYRIVYFSETGKGITVFANNASRSIIGETESELDMDDFIALRKGSKFTILL